MKNLALFIILLIVGSCERGKKSTSEIELNQEDAFYIVEVDSTEQAEVISLQDNMQDVQSMELPEYKGKLDELPDLTEFRPSNFVNDSLDIGILKDADIDSYPYSTSGLLLVDDRNGRTFSCSCQFVSKTVVLTAAHCLYDKKRRIELRNIRVLQGYRNGNFRKRHVASRWGMSPRYDSAKKTSDEARYDYAFIKVRSSSDWGNLGLITSHGTSGVTVMGYPSNIKRGNVLQQFIQNTSNRLPYNMFVISNSGNFYKGSSGGAWFTRDYNAMSVTSMGFTTSNGYKILVGSIFDSHTWDLYDNVK